mmetsp:Transcript_70088/g.116401  ORF Transcript_70088/g.116401 Transcript_70088/m.116401 type:complete len:317 (+) Transcript_70088:560-1510(+)
MAGDGETGAAGGTSFSTSRSTHTASVIMYPRSSMYVRSSRTRSLTMCVRITSVGGASAVRLTVAGGVLDSERVRAGADAGVPAGARSSINELPTFLGFFRSFLFAFDRSLPVKIVSGSGAVWSVSTPFAASTCDSLPAGALSSSGSHRTARFLFFDWSDGSVGGSSSSMRETHCFFAAGGIARLAAGAMAPTLFLFRTALASANGPRVLFASASSTSLKHAEFGAAVGLFVVDAAGLPAFFSSEMPCARAACAANMAATPLPAGTTGRFLAPFELSPVCCFELSPEEDSWFSTAAASPSAVLSCFALGLSAFSLLR